MGGIELKPIAPSNKAFNISYLKLYTEIYTEKKTLPTYLYISFGSRPASN